MEKYARIENGRVVETLETDGDITQMFHRDLDWRPAPAGCAEGWLVFNGAIVPPDHYKVLRAAAYPPISDFADGMVKVHSDDPATQAAGDAQVAAYCNACLAVKLQFPKV